MLFLLKLSRKSFYYNIDEARFKVATTICVFKKRVKNTDFEYLKNGI